MCPFSSILLFLCMSPFENSFDKLSDDIPGYSLARVYADDLGSALCMLQTVEIDATILKMGCVCG